MNSDIFELADSVLLKLMESPLDGFDKEAKTTFIQGVNSVDLSRAFAILRSRGYVKWPINTKTGKLSGSVLYITNEGGDFILSGGFAERFKHEKLKAEEMIANTKAAEAACKMAVFQKRAMLATIVIAALTLLALISQLIHQCCHISW